MNADDSEELFRSYLKDSRLSFRENYKLQKGDIDFCVSSDGVDVLCEVKEVRNSTIESIEGVDAQKHIRSDIRKLRAKFGEVRPEYPVLLVTMNYSTNYFTGLTVARALLGEVGVEFDRNTKQITKPLHHLPKGNATLTHSYNRSISGVFVFDRSGSRHCMFLSPFADNLPPLKYFPGVRVINLDRESTGNNLMELGNMIFWNVEFSDQT